ncbi:hypothetical protein OM427_08370 [Halomonas sp. 18H]|uniref:hypothetical protein n=1 Tax=Halomonas almeriensis TaxID=308163 RepID=UPI00222F3396|nr:MULTISPECIES: hypothetical protein [Halomonas]MCW4149541.1 hypothetical protein [Halomonas sp. 18H]MDN3553513.1 hypothetical protein [Halomonas almeriensis]
MQKTLLSAVLLGACLLANAASAQESPLESTLKSYLVVKEAGEERMMPAEEAGPGDIIEYRLMYTNVSDRTLSGLVINGPIPSNTSYLADTNSASVNAKFTVSAGQGDDFQSEPYTRTVTDEDGDQREEVVPPEDYAQLRWEPVDSIAPDQTQTYVYRVQVD